MELNTPTDKDEDALALDIIPDSSNPGVREWLKKLPQLFMAHQILLTLGVVGRYQHIATNASATDATVLVKVQNGLFNLIKCLDAVSLMLGSFRMGANNILEKLKVAYLYLLDGFPDFAMTDIEAIVKDVGTMKANTEKALGVISETEKSMQEAYTFAQSKNGHEAKIASIEDDIDKLSDRYRRISEDISRAGDEASLMNSKEPGAWHQRFCPFLKFSIIGYLKDWISLLITVAVFVAFYVGLFVFDNKIVGLVVLILAPCLFLFRFALVKILKANYVDYTPVIPIMICLTVFALFPCHLIEKKSSTATAVMSGGGGSMPNDELHNYVCFIALPVVPILVLLILIVAFSCHPKAKFFEVGTRMAATSDFIPLQIFKGSNQSVQGLRDDLQRIKAEQLDKIAEKHNLEVSIGDAQLAKCFLGKALNDLKSVSGILKQSTGVVETWYKECKDIIEPSFDKKIKKAEDIPEEQRKDYWNSMAFKKEVIGYYCRWKALQEYCATLSSQSKKKRDELELRYTENPLPREAIIQAWKAAEEEMSDPDVAKVMKDHEERIKDGNGHDLSKRVNSKTRETRLDRE